MRHSELAGVSEGAQCGGGGPGLQKRSSGNHAAIML